MPVSTTASVDRDGSNKEKSRLNSQSGTRRSSVTFSIDSSSSSAPNFISSLKDSQSCGTERSTFLERKIDSLPSKCLGDSVDSKFPMESAAFCPLLPPEKYRERVLTSDALQRRRIKPGLVSDREKASYRSRIGVVDGVRDLQQAVTGLLCRHNREALEHVPEYDIKNRKDLEKNGCQDFFLTDISYGDHLNAQSHPVDDRITPQTLHTLLRNSRITVAKILPPSLEPREVVQYTASMKLPENNSVLRSELNRTKESLVPTRRQGKKSGPGQSSQDAGKMARNSLQVNEKKKGESGIRAIGLSGSRRSSAQVGPAPEEATATAATAAEAPFSFSPHSPSSQLPRQPPSRAKPKTASQSYKKRRTAQGETPDEFIRRTACPRSSSRPTSANALAERVSPAVQLSSTSSSNTSPGTIVTARLALEQEHISHGLKEMLLADVRYSEAPNLALAHKASYYSTTRDDAAPPGGIGIGFPSVPLQEKHPVEGCLTYPPAPITYESKEIEKKALSLQRLALQSGKKSATAVKSPTTKNDFLELLDQREEKDREEGSFGYRVKEGSVLDYTFRIGSPGEDSSVVSQLVKEVIEARLREQEQERKERKLRGLPIGDGLARASPWNSSPTSKLPLQASRGPGFSLVESVLKVSREIELFRNGKNTLDSKSSSSLSAQRQEAAEQLVAFRSSRIPEEFWLSITDKNISACTRLLQKKINSKHSQRFYQGKRVSVEETNQAESDSARSEKQDLKSMKGESLDNCSHIGIRSRSRDAGSEGAIIFPGAKPVERSQVYLLADVLDLMVRQVKDYYLLFDASTAKKILPSSVDHSTDCGRKGSNREFPLPSYAGREEGEEVMKVNALSSYSSEVDNLLLLPEVQERSAQVHLAYTTVADQVVNIFDIGISEVVRQVGSHCIERGALLDTLRQSLVDLTKSSINLLYHAKEVAFKEASKRRDIQVELQRVQRQMLEQALRIQELEMDNSVLYEWNSTLQLKASRMDTLLERMEEKKKRYDFHSEDEHAFLLMELEKDMISTASKAVEVIDTQKAHFSAFSNQSPGQAPTAAEARKRVLDANSAMQTLYSESASLLTALRSCGATTNTACAAFYDNVSLGTLSPSANLPAAKWASVARAVGDFEKEKVHRYRVFNVFSRWCSRFKKAQEEEEDTREGGNFLLDSSPDNSLDNSLHNHSNEKSISVDSDDKGTLVRRRPPGDRSQSEKRFHDSEKSQSTFARSVGEETKSMHSQDSSADDPISCTSPKLITFQELQELQVYDCTPAEVNALFERKFDFKTFLHAPWEPSDSHYKLNISDVADMVHDVRVFIQELTVRMQALNDSAIMKKGIEPPLSPPANPEVPCPLCARREVSGERRKHQEALQFIAREVQQQMEDLTRKFQKAESEREDARGEARRLNHELEAALEREAALRAEVDELLQARFTVKTSDGKGQRDTTMNGASDSSKNFSTNTASYATLQDTAEFSDDFSRSSLLHTVGKTGKTMSKGLLLNVNALGIDKRRVSPVVEKKKRLSFTEEMLSHMSEVLSARQNRSSIEGGSILQANNTMPNDNLVEIAEESKTGFSQDSLLVHKVGSSEMEEECFKKSRSSSGHSGVVFHTEGPDLEKSRSTSY